MPALQKSSTFDYSILQIFTSKFFGAYSKVYTFSQEIKLGFIQKNKSFAENPKRYGSVVARLATVPF